MDSATRSSLHDLTLEARRLLSTEIQGLLEGVYGLSPDGRLEPQDRLPAVQELSEARETRSRLEQHLADEAEAGIKRAEAVDKLVKETAYTHLNRLVAFKMLEARGLIRGTINRHHDSNGFKFHLTENEEDHERYASGDLPKNALEEGPRDVAYRRFLLDQCRRLVGEIRFLFDPDDLASRLFPRPRALRDLVELLNAPEVEGVWEHGSEEAIGWVYQYFNEQEKDEVFERLYKKKQKIGAEDVPAATQLFTPRWIVRNLVHNTLGRLWTEMHPDTRLRESLDYLVPLADGAPKPQTKPVREITVLDPACGTMHFGLAAFDLLAGMYREELERAGEPGWPEEPSVADESQIPAAILRNNLFGMDIDPRAVQLSVLALYLKAKSAEPGVVITEIQLACSGVRPPDHLDEFLAESDLGPIHERLVREAWRRLQSAPAAGSLVRVEEEIRTLIEKERERYATPELGEEVPEEEFWGGLFDRIRDALDDFEAEHGHGESYFVGEAKRGLRVLDFVLRHYDAVVTNPPYLSRRNAGKELADFLADAYPRSKGDLYTAFIQRCAGMLGEGGRLGMISQQSFMFISSYEKLRAALLEEHAIETVTHVGPRAFAEIGGEKVNTVLFVLRREGENRRGDAAVGTYFRLVGEPEADAKRRGFERALARMNEGEDDPAVFRCRQGDLKAIPGAPWVYWITPGLRRLFTTLPKLADDSPPRQGLATADNFRFLRFWWEVGNKRIAYGCADAREARQSGKRWFPYMKGGNTRWLGDQEYIVNWGQDGAEIKEHILFRYSYLNGKWEWVVKNTEFYFRRGVTFPKISSGSFSARLSPGGFIFAEAGSSLFPEDVYLVLAVMNSTFAVYALRLINPTVNFQVGDLARLPVPTQSSNTLHQLVEEAVGLARAESAEDETTYDFVAPPCWRTGPEDVWRRRARLAEVEAEIDEEVYRLYAISAEDRAAIEAELAEPAAEGAEPEESEESDAPSCRELAEAWISYAVGVVLGRFVPGKEGAIGRGDFPEEVAAGLRQLVDPDGVATLDEGHDDDLAAKVERALELMVGEEEVVPLLEAAGAGGEREGLRRYLARGFFKRHVKLYRKRPVYWLLQSPGKSYGLYLFHERATRDTLYLLTGSRYLGARANGVRQTIADLNERAASAEGREKRRLEKERESQENFLGDLEAFRRELQAVTSMQDERGRTVGWEPELDDGVLINLAPLHRLMPSWSAEPKKAWEALQAGEYDWSRTAMRYWPDRVVEACRENSSFAIAHGRLDTYAGNE